VSQRKEGWLPGQRSFFITPHACDRRQLRTWNARTLNPFLALMLLLCMRPVPANVCSCTCPAAYPITNPTYCVLPCAAD
jgi:hypothetical protein